MALRTSDSSLNHNDLAELASRDPSHDVLRRQSPSLDAIFKPKSVAVIGASETEGSVGRTLLWNLIQSPFGGTVYPVNLKRESVLGIKAYPTIASVPGRVDLAVIATPARTVPGVVRECVQAGVRGAIIISAGFKERGPEGVALEQEILREARIGNMRIIGPNCLGVMRPPFGLNATFASKMAMKGSVGFISQSGALCTSILDWSFRENVGFSAFVSIGSMLDVGWGDLIHYLGNDPQTQSIVIYMESIGDARSFMSAAREVALSKPIIVIKAGRTEAAAQAAASHTGSLTGSDEVLDAAFRRSGVLRVNRIAHLFYMAEVLAKQPRPKGPHLTIVTNAGGPGVLATDALIMSGGELAELSEPTLDILNKVLPDHWSHANPIDVLGDAPPKRYAYALESLRHDENSDGLLVVLSPQSMSEPTKTARAVAQAAAQIDDKPVLASWMGGRDVAAGNDVLSNAGVPTFDYPDSAARMFGYMWRHAYNLKALYETPDLASAGGVEVDTEAVRTLLSDVRSEGRALLNEYESKLVLEAYRIPTITTRVAETEEQALEIAGEMGYPVVLKLHSNTITHKTDVGGVQLNLRTEQAVRDAYARIRGGVGAGDFLGVTVQPMAKLDGYEVIIGSSIDVQFGPVLLFGSGGSLVEVYKDRALGLPPLNTTLARRMMEQTKIHEALKGVRGRPPVDLDELEKIIVRFSEIVVEHPEIKEIEINPMLASHERLLALDARVVLHPPEIDLKTVPKPAIRPYPTRYVEDWAMRDGTVAVIRPIRPEDEPLMVDLHKALSSESVYFRYFQPMKLEQRIRHSRLSRIVFVDYDREMALVVERENPESGDPEIVGVGRLSRSALNPDEAEFSVLIRDEVQRQGVGTELLRRLVEIGKEEGLSRITAEVLPENAGMRRVFKKLDFATRIDAESGSIHAERVLV
ncbi:MAG: bifunctional acetate--CoA ligase family protein/GNAT family N-acetyltransferase [Bacteroidota bacterium]